MRALARRSVVHPLLFLAPRAFIVHTAARGTAGMSTAGMSTAGMSTAGALGGAARSPRSAEAMARRLRDPRPLLLDGGTGEELFRRGVPDDHKLWSATALVHDEHHATVRNVHRSFLRAGSDAVTTNSYGCVPGVGFDRDGVRRYCGVAGRLARQAVDEWNAGAGDAAAFVCGSLGPLVESYRADLILPHDDGVSYYGTMVEALRPYVDCFLAETMSGVEEAMQAVDAVSRMESSERKPCFVSFTLHANGALRSGDAAPAGVQRIMDYCDAKRVILTGVLFNCATPEAITLALQGIAAEPSLGGRLRSRGIRLGAYANRLTPVDPNWVMSEMSQPFRDDVDPQQYYEDFVRNWVLDLGVNIVGGCCGISPEHIALLNDKLRPENMAPSNTIESKLL